LKSILLWDDVKTVASQVFSIWVDHPELKWAEQAWEIIIGVGLATYSNEDERCNAAIRFLALSGIYYDFCEIGLEEHNVPEYGIWAEELEIGATRIGLLIASNPDDRLSLSDDDGELYSEGVKYLADKARVEVLKALCKGFSKFNDRTEGNETDLFLSLWKSNWPEPDPDESDEDDPETDFEIMNDVTEGKAAVYEWISSRCESLH